MGLVMGRQLLYKYRKLVFVYGSELLCARRDSNPEPSDP